MGGRLFSEATTNYVKLLFMSDQLNALNTKAGLCKIILKILDTAVVVINTEGKLRYFNDAARDLLRISGGETKLTTIYSFLDIFSGATRNNLKEVILQVLNNQPLGDVRLGPVDRIENKRKMVYKTSIKVIKNKEQELWGVLLFFTDISEKKEIERNIIQKSKYLSIKNKIANLLNSSSDLDKIANVIRMGFKLHTFHIALYTRNKSCLKIMGTSTILPPSVKKMIKLVTIDFNVNKTAKRYFCSLKEPDEINMEIFLKYISIGDEQANVKNIQNGLLNRISKQKVGKIMNVPLINAKGDFIGALIAMKRRNEFFDEEEKGTFKDFTDTICLGIERLLNEHKINKLAYFDELTGLPNLKLFKDSLEDKIHYGENFTLFLVKLRDFSKVVSSRGDIISDQTIIAVSQTIKKAIDKYFSAIFSRGTGASFIFCINNCKEIKAKEVVNNLIYLFSKPLNISGNLIHINISIGIAFSGRGENPDSLIQKCNVALERAKEKVKLSFKIKNNYEFFNDHMIIYRKIEEKLEEEIRAALDEKVNFITHYQPKGDTNGDIKGYEALVRWKKDDQFVFPGTFIPKINKMGLSDRLFSIVLEKVCSDLAIINNPGASISINIEPAQFEDPLLIAKINRTFRKYDISPDKYNIKLEIIETDLINAKNIQVIRDIHNLGLKISVDDFGSGYSNLKTINELSRSNLIDEIKIDRSLIQGITIDASLINIILEMAKKLEIDIVAEGVETIEQYTVLKEIYPEVIIQGWLFSKAIPVEKVPNVPDFKNKLAQLLAEMEGR